MFRRRRVVVWFVFLMVALTLTACGSQPNANNDSNATLGENEKSSQIQEDAEETITWEYFSFMAPTNFMHIQAEEFAEKVKEETDGRLEIIVRAGGELPYNVAEIPTVVGNGQVDMGDNLVAYSSGLLDVGPISTLPYLAETYEDARTIRDVLASYMDEEYGSFGAQVLFTYPWPQQQFWGAGEPIKTLDDIKGKKIRVVGAEWGDLVTMFGGTPVTIGPTEVPTAVERGVMDAFHTAATTVATNGWQDFTEWVYKADMASGGISYIIVNQEQIDALPADVREILFNVAKEHEEEVWSEMPQVDKENYNKLVESGIQVYEALPEDRDRAIEMLSSYWDEWAVKRGDKAQGAMAEVKEALGM